jgi:hypothetical protein
MSNWKENTFIIDVRRRFTSRWACFEAKSGAGSIRRVKCNKSSVYTSKYIQLERKYVHYRRMAAFYEPLGLFRSKKWRALHSTCEMQQKQRLNVEISPSGKKIRSKLAKGTVLRIGGLVSMLKVACVEFLV